MRQQRRLSVVSLFSGIGGFELGLQAAGHETVQFWELMPEAQACLRQNFQASSIEVDGDITRAGFAAALPARFDVLTAGFPCQDLSQAGRTEGISGARSGLILHVLDTLEARPQANRPPWLLLENVAFMRHLGGGKAMRVVLDRLSELGYRWAYRQVDSNAFGLPQRRKRIYFVACQPWEGDPRSVLFADDGTRPERVLAPGWLNGTACGFYWTEGNRGLGWGYDLVPAFKVGSSLQLPSPPAILHPIEGLVTPTISDAEALQGFSRGWTAPAEGVNRDRQGRWRWHLVGNAVSVPVSTWLGRRIAESRSPLPEIMKSSTPLPPGGKWPPAAYRMEASTDIMSVEAGDWPTTEASLTELSLPRWTLTELLANSDSEEQRPALSYRATRGFRQRFDQSSLLKRNSPRLRKALLSELRKHEDKMQAKRL